jgi:hypothetical protein
MSDDPLDYEPVDDWLSFDIRSISVIRVSHLTVSGIIPGIGYFAGKQTTFFKERNGIA